MSLPFRIAKITAVILIAAILISLFTGLMLVKYPLFPWINYNLVRDIHVSFILIVLIPAFYLHTLAGILMFLNGKGLAKTRWQKGSVIAGWALVFLVFLILYAIPAPAVPPTGPATPVTGASQLAGPAISLTQAEIGTHNSASSCWVVIDGKVYDLTSFLGIHPGGTGAIASYCGKDGSTGFATKGIGILHSSYAGSLLNSYFIGDLGATVNVTAPPGAVSPPPVRRHEEGDD